MPLRWSFGWERRGHAAITMPVLADLSPRWPRIRVRCGAPGGSVAPLPRCVFLCLLSRARPGTGHGSKLTEGPSLLTCHRVTAQSGGRGGRHRSVIHRPQTGRCAAAWRGKARRLAHLARQSYNMSENVGQTSCLPVRAASCRPNDGGKDALSTGRLEACPTFLDTETEYEGPADLRKAKGSVITIGTMRSFVRLFTPCRASSASGIPVPFTIS